MSKSSTHVLTPAVRCLGWAIVSSASPLHKVPNIHTDFGEQEGLVANASSGMVSAFAQSNVGDTSPNIQGAFCQDTGKAIEHNTKSSSKTGSAAPTRIRTGVS